MCPQKLSAIKRVYEKWKKHDVEEVYVSLDEDQSDFVSSSSTYPFISFRDYKGWEAPSTKDFYAFATPTLFLLKQNLEILLRHHAVSQVDAWVDWVLVEGNT